MTLPPKILLRLEFLSRVVQKETKHLITTDHRLFGTGFTLKQASELEDMPDLAERADAFVGRFGRLQDTLGDKLLPILLIALGEKTHSAIDNLDRAERLGFIESTDNWMAMRTLRNQMVHEYVEDPVLLHAALISGHDFVPALTSTAYKMISEVGSRIHQPPLATH